MGIPAWACSKNFAYTETLAPGAVYERSADLYVQRNSPTGMHRFRLGFQPFSVATPVWSEPLAIQVRRGPLAEANFTGTIVGTIAAIVLAAGALFWLRKRHTGLQAQTSLVGRLSRGVAIAFCVGWFALLASSYWRESSVYLRIAAGQVIASTLRIFIPSGGHELTWRSEPVDGDFFFTEYGYASASFHHFGIAYSQQGGSGNIIVPLWIPCLMSVVGVLGVWQLTTRRRAAFPVETSMIQAA